MKMKTIQIGSFGGPDGLEIAERKKPNVGPGQVLIQSHCAGINGPDIMQRMGLYPPPKGASDLMGLEVSGEVVEVGEGLETWSVGDEVCALTHGGSYAEYVAVNADHCLPIPSGVSLEDAAGLPETYFTVWNNIFYNRTIPAGSNFLVHGGSGGIGTTAIQLGAALGLEVFATASNEEKCKFCEELGAVKGINYRETDFVEEVKKLGGADLILDILGGDYFQRNLSAANLDARIVQLAFRKGSKVEADLMPIMLKRLTVHGSTLRPRSNEFKAAIASDLLEKVWPLFEQGKLRPLTHAVFPFEEIAAAHQMMEDAKHVGKILIKFR